MLQRHLEDAMRRALTLATRGPAHNENPRVGCVLVDADGRIVAEGWHKGAGTPHAETDALAHLPTVWKDRARELTAVVTLEPCNHTGHTGPCADALMQAGVGAVAFSVTDRGVLSRGGASALRAAGIDVVSGVLEREGEELLAIWHREQGLDTLIPSDTDGAEFDATQTTSAALPRTKSPRADDQRASKPSTARPRIIAKWAQTLDGRAAAADGSSQWITGPAARADVHERRAQADAILVGTGTLLHDDPALTARTPSGDLLVPAAQQPVPVILGARPIPNSAAIKRHPALAARGLSSPLRLSGENLSDDLAQLAEQGISSVFIEGGPATVSSFLAAGLVDECLVYIAPALLGGPKVAVDEIGSTSMAEILRFDTFETTRLGDDILVRAFNPRVASSAGVTAPKERQRSVHGTH